MDFFNKYKTPIFVVLGLIIVFIIVRAIQNRAPSMTLPNGGTAGGGVIPARFKYDASKVDRMQTIGVGTKNSHAVAYLQTWLNRYYDSKLAVDGDFGSKTNAALIAAKPNAPITFTLETLAI